MNNKLIKRKIINNTEYLFRQKYGVFSIYKTDKNVTQMHKMQEVFKSRNESEAREYWKNIK